jgi:PEGA domain
MRVSIRSWILCWGIAWAGAAAAAPGGSPPAPAPAGAAAPKVDPQAQLKQAEQLFKDRQHKQALAAINEGLAAAPKHLSLLYLKGTVLLDMTDYSGALAAFQAFVAISPPDARWAQAKKSIQMLIATKTTFLEVTVANGPADIYLGLRARGVFCRAEPSCKKALPPGQHKLIAERPGFERWTGRATVAVGQVTGAAITLVEKPSALTVRGAPPGATFTLDGAAWSPPAPVAAGKHELAVSLAGYAEERRAFEVHEGKPLELDVPLTPLVQIRGAPPGAEVLLDGQPLAADPRGVKLAPGAHTVVARAPGYRERRVAIPVERAPGYAVVLELEREAPPERFSLRRKLALGAAGVGVVAAGAGVVLGLRAGKLADDAYKLCPDPSIECFFAAEATDLNARARSSARVANVAFGVAGGAAITAAVLWLTGGHERRAASPGPRVSVHPRLGAISGLDLAVRF